MNVKIAEFLKKQTAASISCVNEVNEPYSFSCFFVFNSKENLLYYKSPAASYHSLLLRQRPKVSGTIMPDKLNKLSFKGIQFTGEVLSENDALGVGASDTYHRKIPVAAAISGVVCTIQLTQVRMISNVIGIIEKLSWQREEPVSKQSD